MKRRLTPEKGLFGATGRRVLHGEADPAAAGAVYIGRASQEMGKAEYRKLIAETMGVPREQWLKHGERGAGWADWKDLGVMVPAHAEGVMNRAFGKKFRNMGMLVRTAFPAAAGTATGRALLGVADWLSHRNNTWKRNVLLYAPAFSWSTP